MSEQKFFENNSNNMETQKSQQETFKATPDVSKDLADDVLRAQKSDAEAQQALANEPDAQRQYDKTLESVKTGISPEQESSDRRRAYMKEGFKLIANALEAQLNKGYFARGFVSKKEIQECLNQFNDRSNHLERDKVVDSINWAVVLNQAKFVEKKELLPQLEDLKNVYLKPEDLEKLDPKKMQHESQITHTSIGASGDGVQF